MARRALVKRGEEPDAENREEPPFLLLTRHERDGGTYWLGLAIRCRDEDIEALLRRHGLGEWEVYVDSEHAREVEQARQRLRDEKSAGYGARPLTYFASPEWQWATLKQLWQSHRAGRVLRISVGDLLDEDGVWISGTLEEMRELEQAVLSKVDVLAASIVAGGDFDESSVTIFAPGSRRPEEPDGGTPPDGWRS